jgi:hypothetical protein
MALSGAFAPRPAWSAVPVPSPFVQSDGAASNVAHDDVVLLRAPVRKKQCVSLAATTGFTRMNQPALDQSDVSQPSWRLKRWLACRSRTLAS